MGQKDVAEKVLEAYNDVFSDIVNVLLFDGRQVVKEDELTDAVPLSQYKADGKLHEQERDVAKFWNKSNVRIALYGLENQTAIDIDMPLRVMSYDGAEYRAQMLQDGKKPRYPVVTLVLYFGEKPWNSPKSLYECLTIPEELKPYISDYKLNIFDIPRLNEKQVSAFQSDFKIVAEFFTHMYHDPGFRPEPAMVRHVHEILQLMAVLTGDHRFEEYENERKEGVAATMCEVLDWVENRGRADGLQQGVQQGMQQGMQKATLQSLKSIMERLSLSAAAAMEALGIPSAEQGMYMQMLENTQ